MISQHFSPRGTAGLASICAATAIISLIGHRSLARLNDEHARNQTEIANVREQIEALNQSLAQQKSETIENAALASWVNRSPASRLLAETSGKLPADCCAEMITSGTQRVKNRFAIQMRCADVTKFRPQTGNQVEDIRTQTTSIWIKTNTISDRTGAGFGWSPTPSATLVCTTELSPIDSVASLN